LAAALLSDPLKELKRSQEHLATVRGLVLKEEKEEDVEGKEGYVKEGSEGREGRVHLA